MARITGVMCFTQLKNNERNILNSLKEYRVHNLHKSEFCLDNLSERALHSLFYSFNQLNMLFIQVAI